MIFNQWITENPEFTQECLVICANEIKGVWDYDFFQVTKITTNEGWYWGWCDASGEEYGDLDDMQAQKYFLINPISENINTK